MIYTITLNPAVDYIMSLDGLNMGKTNRSTCETVKWGGKGINVSTVLNNLDIDNTALGFVAGFTGHALENGLKENGIKTDFVHLEDGLTRINVKLPDSDTEINGNGPLIKEEDIEKLLARLKQLKENDYVVIAGNAPSNMPNNIYERIIKAAGKAAIIVDTSKELLLNCLKYKPFLVKPNHHELGELFDCNIDLEAGNYIEVSMQLAGRLQNMGARNVCVSLSFRGALLLTENGESYYETGQKGNVISTVGAGDSMVAGFLADYIKNDDLKHALEAGVAAASASCFSGTLATKQNIEKFCKY